MWLGGRQYHTMSVAVSAKLSLRCEDGVTNAIMLTLFPLALSSMTLAKLVALVSTEPAGGTSAVMTSTSFSASASVIPRQYWTPGRYGPARWSTSKPNNPWARMMGCFGGPAKNQSMEIVPKEDWQTIVLSNDRKIVFNYSAIVPQSRIFLPLRYTKRNAS